MLAGSTTSDPATGQGSSVLAGDDPFIFPSITMGATRAIAASSDIDTAAYVAMVHYGLHQRREQGRECAEALLPLTRALFAEPNPLVLEAVLHAEGRIPTADVRAPLLNCSLEMARLAQQARTDRRVRQSA